MQSNHSEPFESMAAIVGALLVGIIAYLTIGLSPAAYAAASAGGALLGGAVSHSVKVKSVSASSLICVLVGILLVFFSCTNGKASDPKPTPAAGPKTKVAVSQTSTRTSIPKPKPKPKPKLTFASYLVDVDPVSGEWSDNLLSTTSAFSIDGQGFTKGVWAEDCFASSGPNNVSYNLEKKYQELDTVAGITDLTNSQWKSRIDFINGRNIIKSVLVHSGKKYPLRINLTDVFTLTIRITTLAGPGGCGAQVPIGPALGNPKLLNYQTR